MVYETVVVLRPDLSEEILTKFIQTFKDALKSFEGEILVEDNWGIKAFAQATKSNQTRGLYLYFMYRAKGDANFELERNNRINENVIRFLTVLVGPEAKAEAFKQAYVKPSQSRGENRREAEKEKKMFSKKRSCYFSANKTQPDWKDPNTYSWLVNEFGKISPARLTGLRPKYQRMANSAIKRARIVGLMSYVSNNIAN